MSTKDYAVGFKRPPKATQFKPGQSGNPNGRPKGCKNLSTDLREEMSQQVSVNEGGTHQVISKQRAMLKSLFARAIKGDARATSILINLILGLPEQSAPGNTKPLAPDDQALLDAFRDDVLKRHSKEDKGDE